MEEKSQEQIIFENTHSDHMWGWWREHKYKSHGNVMHWCYVIFNLSIADSSSYGFKDDIGEVTYYGDVIAKYRFDDELEMPIFYDIIEKYDFAEHRQEVYLQGLANGLKEPFELKFQKNDTTEK